MKELRYSLKEISSDVAISVRELRKFINAGELNARKIGRAFAVTSADLDDFLNTQFPISSHFCREYEKSIGNVVAEEPAFGSDLEFLPDNSGVWYKRTPVWV